MAAQSLNRHPIALLAIGLLTFAAALWVRLMGIDSRDLWLDEIYTQFAASREWLALVDDRVSRGHSPFYFAILKATGIDAANITGIRALSAGFDAAAAGVLAAGTLRFFGLRAALMVAGLYTLSALHIHWAQNARPYALLMLFIALGLVGAIGLIDSKGQERAPRRAHWLFALGWSGACFTLTGGILAYLVVLSLPWWPGLRRGALADPLFRQRWVRAQKIPSIVAFLTYMLISRVHVYDRIGDYWLESRRPFGLESLQLLMAEIGGGDIGVLSTTISFAVVLVLLVCAACALPQRHLRPRAFPIFALGFGVLVVMLLMSLNTSLLTGRYFTPPWMGVLVTAGVGIAALRPLPLALVSAPIFGLLGAFATVTANSSSALRDETMKEIAVVIDASETRHAPIVIDRDIFREVRMELMLLRLDEPSLPRPEMDGAKDGEEVAARREEGGPFFIVARDVEWQSLRAVHSLEGACIAPIGPWLVVQMSDGRCQTPFRAQ